VNNALKEKEKIENKKKNGSWRNKGHDLALFVLPRGRLMRHSIDFTKMGKQKKETNQ
jgi:hypothetical protein